jgi:hypothetical protein
MSLLRARLSVVTAPAGSDIHQILADRLQAVAGRAGAACA